MKSNTSLKHIQPVVVDTSHSPFSRLQQPALTEVNLEDDFWCSRFETNRRVMLPVQYRLLEETGRIDNFRRASGRKQIEFQGIFFNDSDVYKWVEAAVWSLSTSHDAGLESLVDDVIDEICSAQQPDGYLNTYFIFEKATERWTDFDLHELYCAGHLIQAAVAHHRVTKKNTLLDVALRFADHICDWFGPEEDGKHFGADGHPEIEMALVELYRLTGEEKYLQQALYFIDVRGSGKLARAFLRDDPSYHQDHLPFRQLTRLVGHAVRAVYLNCGATDVFCETGENDLYTALDKMWHNMVFRQLYLNGGLGSRYENEGFGEDYELPNGRAHCESCASVANFMWNARMLAINADSRYADIMELALYNSILAGVSLDGESYFYQNPLLDDGSHRRQRWFSVSCCPSNISRLLSTLPSYLYGVSQEGVWVHLYASSQATLNISDGREVRLIQRTGYPWSGEIELQLQSEGRFSLFLRLPGWCGSGWTVTLNGERINEPLNQNGYLRLERQWQVGDVVRFSLPLAVRRVSCNPYVVENQGRVALMRGPLLYCLESVDHAGEDVRYFVLPDKEQLSSEFMPDFLGGVTVLHGKAIISADDENWGDALYLSDRQFHGLHDGRVVNMTAIPYYAWANRAPSSMVIWLRSG